MLSLVVDRMHVGVVGCHRKAIKVIECLIAHRKAIEVIQCLIAAHFLKAQRKIKLILNKIEA